MLRKKFILARASSNASTQMVHGFGNSEDLIQIVREADNDRFFAIYEQNATLTLLNVGKAQP